VILAVQVSRTYQHWDHQDRSHDDNGLDQLKRCTDAFDREQPMLRMMWLEWNWNEMK
jgi:hypothetical protein